VLFAEQIASAFAITFRSRARDHLTDSLLSRSAGKLYDASWKVSSVVTKRMSTEMSWRGEGFPLLRDCVPFRVLWRKIWMPKLIPFQGRPGLSDDHWPRDVLHRARTFWPSDCPQSTPHSAGAVSLEATPPFHQTNLSRL